jgi:hypothetical protein
MRTGRRKPSFAFAGSFKLLSSQWPPCKHFLSFIRRLSPRVRWSNGSGNITLFHWSKIIRQIWQTLKWRCLLNLSMISLTIHSCFIGVRIVWLPFVRFVFPCFMKSSQFLRTVPLSILGTRPIVANTAGFPESMCNNWHAW